MGKTIGYAVLVVMLLAASGCAPGIPANVLTNVDQSITFRMLIQDPSAYEGKTVVAGGVIVKSTNEKSGNTRLEIMELPLDSYYEPLKGDRSNGRFMAVYKGYLETRIFEPGRFVTVVGTVAESTSGTVGNMTYTFPVIGATYIKLWPVQHNPAPVYTFGFGFDYGPFAFPPWWYYPYGPVWY